MIREFELRIAIMFGLTEKFLDKSGLDRFTSRKDYMGPLVCGFTSGAVFKSTGKNIEGFFNLHFLN